MISVVVCKNLPHLGDLILGTDSATGLGRRKTQQTIGAGPASASSSVHPTRSTQSFMWGCSGEVRPRFGHIRDEVTSILFLIAPDMIWCGLTSVLMASQNMLVDYIEAEISVTSKVLLKEHIQPVADAGNWF